MGSAAHIRPTTIGQTSTATAASASSIPASTTTNAAANRQRTSATLRRSASRSARVRTKGGGEPLLRLSITTKVRAERRSGQWAPQPIFTGPDAGEPLQLPSAATPRARRRSKGAVPSHTVHSEAPCVARAWPPRSSRVRACTPMGSRPHIRAVRTSRCPLAMVSPSFPGCPDRLKGAAFLHHDRSGYEPVVLQR